MSSISGISDKSAVGLGSAAVVGSMVVQTAGGAFAKLLFPALGAHGVTAMRIGLAALIMLAVRRPWRRMPDRSQFASLVGFGLLIGSMNVLFYQSFARIPIGVATAIEVTGPLAIVLMGSRRPRDFAWLLMAVAGLLMLLPIAGGAALDPIGVAFACGAAVCWALYIVLGKRVSASVGSDAATWGLIAAAVLFVPVSLANADMSRLTLPLFAAGIGVAVLASALPYTLEMEGMRRLPSHVFGILSSAAPAVAALIGFVVLGEQLDLRQWTAMFLIVAASVGCAMSSSDVAKTANLRTRRAVSASSAIATSADPAGY